MQVTTAEQVEQVLSRLGNSKILILGDIMLDEYWFGSVSRISPEAPVPVVEITSSKQLLGGAANVAANIRALGDEPILIGMTGDDDAAARLRLLLAAKGIVDDALVVDKARQTTIKTRVIAHSQQVVRTDREDRHPPELKIQKRLWEQFMALSDNVAAVIISDYGKGVITPELLEKVTEVCCDRGVFIAVDPKETNFPNYRHVSLITPNHHEAGFAYGRQILSEEDLIEVGNGLMEKLQAGSILITRGADGMSLFQKNVPPTHIPTFARKVYDVTGAGDTVIAAFVSAVSAGADLVTASVLSNAAAGITVGEVGTASVTVTQLRRELKISVLNGNLPASVG